MHSLLEIEKTVTTMWLNSQVRRWVAEGAPEKKQPGKAAAVIRDIALETDLEGAELYGNLIHYGHHDVIDSIYPFCAGLFGKKWHQIVDRYYEVFPPGHYNLNRICKHFPEFVEKHCDHHLKRYPFMAELADYEWIELEKLEMDCDVIFYDRAAINAPEQIAGLAPAVNPSLTIREYEFPIPEIIRVLESTPRPRRKFSKSKTYLAAYRDSDHRARFLELGSAAAALVTKAQKAPTAYQELLIMAVTMSPESAPEQAVVNFLKLVETLQEAELFVGSTSV